MITTEALAEAVGGVPATEIERYVAEAWVTPVRAGEHLLFRDADVARVRLIVELRGSIGIGDDALPVVLSLLDQLYEARRRMRLVCRAIEEAEAGRAKPAVAEQVRALLRDAAG